MNALELLKLTYSDNATTLESEEEDSSDTLSRDILTIQQNVAGTIAQTPDASHSPPTANGTKLPLANLLPPEILQLIFTFVRTPVPRNVSAEERRNHHIQTSKAYHTCAMTCRGWNPVAVQFLAQDMIVNFKRIRVLSFVETLGFVSAPVGKPGGGRVWGERHWDSSKVRRITFGVRDDISPICFNLRKFGNLRVVAVNESTVTPEDLANLFANCPKLGCLSITIRNIYKSGQDTSVSKPVAAALEDGVGKLRMLDIDIQCGVWVHENSRGFGAGTIRVIVGTGELRFINLILSNVTSTLRALTYIPPPARTTDDWPAPFHNHQPSNLQFLEYSAGEYLNSISNLYSQLVSAPNNLTTLIIHKVLLRGILAQAICNGCPNLRTLALRDVELTSEAVSKLATGPNITTFIVHHEFLSPRGAGALPGTRGRREVIDWRDLISRRASYWINLQVRGIAMTVEVMDLLAEKGRESLQNVRLPRCLGGDRHTEGVAATLRFVRTCRRLQRFSLNVDGGPELKALLAERGIQQCRMMDGRDERELLEEDITWAA
ncbi:hypothetical protein HDV00_000294 [Rhizophlyctis rosea]|nr:hypothetical protein HDV00_000294 [Rhizophlyctis rosea]